MCIFDTYARIAFEIEQGSRNPPRPAYTLEEIKRNGQIKQLVEEAVKQFCWQHIELDNEINKQHVSFSPQQRFDEAMKKFQKLFDLGVISLQATRTPTIIHITMLVWNGAEYVPVNEILSSIFSEEKKSSFLGPEEYDFEDGMESGDLEPEN